MPPIIKHNGSSLITDYVLSCDSVPIMSEKNRDKTIIVSSFDFVINNLYAKPAKNDIIRVYSNESTPYPFFSGIILKVSTDYNNDTYIITVISEFNKLQNIRLTFNNLHGTLTDTNNKNEYCASDNYGLPNVQVLYAIKQMFLTCNMFLQISTALKNHFIKEVSFDNVIYNMNAEHLVFDENMMYALNQNFALSTDGIKADPEKRILIPSFLDFISEFCSHIGAHIFLVSFGNPNWYIMDLSGNPISAHPDDFVYGKSIKEYIGSDEGYQHNIRFNPNRSTYNTTTLDSLVDHQYLSGDGVTEIELYQNWIYLFRKTSAMNGLPGDVLMNAATSRIYYPEYNWIANSFLQNKIQAAINDFEELELIINHYLPTNTKSARLDLETEEAELISSVKK